MGLRAGRRWLRCLESRVEIVVGRGLGSKSLPIVGVAGGRTASISGSSFTPVLSGGGFVRVVDGPEQSVQLAAELRGCVEPRCGQRLPTHLSLDKTTC